MGKGKPLTAVKNGMILTFKGGNKSARRIANELGRSKDVVLNFLRDPDNYSKK